MKKIIFVLLAAFVIPLFFISSGGRDEPDHKSITYNGYQISIGDSKEQVDTILGKATEKPDMEETFAVYTCYAYRNESIYIGYAQNQVAKIEVLRPSSQMQFYQYKQGMHPDDIVKVFGYGYQGKYNADYMEDGKKHEYRDGLGGTENYSKYSQRFVIDEGTNKLLSFTVALRY